jgi:hypothetical protein
MTEIARRWAVLAPAIAAGVAGAICLTSAPAAAQPLLPQPPAPVLPVPAPVPQAVPVAAPQAQLGTAPQAQLGTAPAVPVQTVPAVPQIQPATSGTLSDFFAGKGVKMEPQHASQLQALNIVLPMPPGWSQVPDPNVPDAFGVIADRVGGDGLYTSNAQVKVYKLVGDFDPKEAISHGFIDSQQLPAWRATDGSLADFNGMPSSRIEGTYRENAMTLNTSRRNVIATSGADRYLVSLAVTTSVDQAIAAADATDAIVNGFKINIPGAAPAAPAAPALPAAPAAPAAPVSPVSQAVPGAATALAGIPQLLSGLAG